MRAALALFILLASGAQASDADTIFMHQRFHDAPTEWCAKDEGVPAVLISDGPDVFRGEFARDAIPRVRVRRGGGAGEVVDNDGAILMSGDIEQPPIYPGTNQFFWGGSFPKGLRMGDATLIIKNSPNAIRTTEAFASPAEEKSP